MSSSEFGSKLKRLRLEAHYDKAREFAHALDWTPSRLSKFETGIRVPTPKDIDRIAEVLELPEAIRIDLMRLAARDNGDDPGTRYARSQEELYDAELAAESIWQYEPTHIPAALQLPEYMNWILERDRVRYCVEPYAIDAVRNLKSKRVALLDEEQPGGGLRQFRFLIHESVVAALRYPPRIDSSRALLERILPRQRTRLSDLSRADPDAPVQIRVVRSPVAHAEGLSQGFRLYDSNLLTFETRNGLEWETAIAEVKLFEDMFQRTWDRTAGDEINEYLASLEADEQRRQELERLHELVGAPR